jgi:hypothetical protein
MNRYKQTEPAASTDVSTLIEGWTAAGADRLAAMRADLGVAGLREEVLVALIDRAGTSKTVAEYQRWAQGAHDYAGEAKLGLSHPLGCLAAAYGAEAYRLRGWGRLSLQTASACVGAVSEHGIGDSFVQAEVFFIAGKAEWEFGTSQRSALRLITKAAELFSLLGDEWKRALAVAFLSTYTVAGDPPWLQAELLAEALSILSPERLETLRRVLLVEVGHSLCDHYHGRAARDLVKLMDRSAQEHFLSRGSTAWLKARYAELQGDAQAACRGFRETQTAYEELTRDLCSLLQARLDVHEGRE